MEGQQYPLSNDILEALKAIIDFEDNLDLEDRDLFDPDDFQKSHPDLIKNAYKLDDSVLK